ncbi:MAG: sensor histidine kinase [Acidimicrobiia bacterium]
MTVMASFHTSDDISQLASAVSAPLLVVDYTPIIERYEGLSILEIERRLADEAELIACLRLPRPLGVSAEWVRLYGLPLQDEVPDLAERQFSGEAFPELRENMVAQFLAPFRGVTSIKSEHVAPAVAGDVTIRSHWKAPIVDGIPDYSRIVIVDLDITDLREIERALEEALEDKDRMMATLSHELRNPLSGVVGFSSILTAEWDSMDELSRLELARDIAAQVGDVSSLLDDFLTFNTSRSLSVEDRPLKLGEILEGLDLDGVSLDVEPGIKIRGDSLRTRQILRNLLRNAERHGGEMRSMRTARRNGMVMVQVRDDGPGVPQEVSVRLFEPFSHGSDPGSLGLGLAVSRRLARAMGGDVSYRREEGITVFELELRPDLT